MNQESSKPPKREAVRRIFIVIGWGVVVLCGGILLAVAIKNLVSTSPARWIIVLDTTSSMGLGLGEKDARRNVECAKGAAADLVKSLGDDSCTCYRVAPSFSAARDTVFQGTLNRRFLFLRSGQRQQWIGDISRLEMEKTSGSTEDQLGRDCGSDYLGVLDTVGNELGDGKPEMKHLVIVGDLINQSSELNLHPLLAPDLYSKEEVDHLRQWTPETGHGEDKTFEDVKIILIRPTGGYIRDKEADERAGNEGAITASRWKDVDSFWRRYFKARGATDIEIRRLRPGAGRSCAGRP